MQGSTKVTLPPTLTWRCDADCHGKYKLTFNVTFKIYVDAGKGSQTRHEQGHVQILENYFNARTEYYHRRYEGLYPSAAACEAAAKKLTGACQRLLDRCSRNLMSFLFLVPIPGFSQKISRQEAAGATIASSLDPQHPGFCEKHFMRAVC